MRKCMKNFNFKLDYNEIDRIIEEQDDGLAAADNNQRQSERQLPEESKDGEETKHVEPSPRHVKPSQRRKQWGQQASADQSPRVAQQ